MFRNPSPCYRIQQVHLVRSSAIQKACQQTRNPPNTNLFNVCSECICWICKQTLQKRHNRQRTRGWSIKTHAIRTGARCTLWLSDKSRQCSFRSAKKPAGDALNANHIPAVGRFVCSPADGRFVWNPFTPIKRFTKLAREMCTRKHSLHPFVWVDFLFSFVDPANEIVEWENTSVGMQMTSIGIHWRGLLRMICVSH